MGLEIGLWLGRSLNLSNLLIPPRRSQLQDTQMFAIIVQMALLAAATATGAAGAGGRGRQLDGLDGPADPESVLARFSQSVAAQLSRSNHHVPCFLSAAACCTLTQLTRGCNMIEGAIARHRQILIKFPSKYKQEASCPLLNLLVYERPTKSSKDSGTMAWLVDHLPIIHQQAANCIFISARSS